MVLCFIAPTFAWYEINGYLYADINNTISKREESEFKLSYALRDMETKNTAIFGIAPKNDFGETVITSANGFAENTAWAKNNAGATTTIEDIILSNGAVILSGQLGEKVSGVVGGGAGDQVEEVNPEDQEDNKVPFLPESRIISLADGDTPSFDINDGESDNRFNITGNFSAEETKIVGVSVSITEKNAESEYDQIAKENVNYAIYYVKTHETIDDAYTEITEENRQKVVFTNNAFNYISNNQPKKAVAQNGYFVAEKGATYEVVAVVWLDGFGDARAESGAFTFSAYLNDLSNITTSIEYNVTEENGKKVATVYNSVETENLIIPSVCYANNGEEITITKVAGDAFKNKTYLESVILPDTIETIYENAFLDCINLNTVSFGNGLTYIGSNAFSGCTSLSSVTFANPYGWTPQVSQRTQTAIITDLVSGTAFTKSTS